jgi:UTP--glucose-1-phosphate uridylyltransferase
MTNSQSPKRIRKAVLPVAGLGTRFLPATKAVPKEMLNIVDRPMIQYIVDEALSAGIEHIVFVTGRNKQIIEDYFDLAYELNDTLTRRGKIEALATLQRMQPAAGAMSFTRQQEPLGLGHAVWCARDIIGDEPFALLLPDMITHGDQPCLKSMVELYNETGGNIVAVQTCNPDDAHKYGIVGMGQTTATGFEISEMVEKPAKGTAPSNLYINGRYILQPEIFAHLARQERGAGGEIQLTDSMLTLSQSQKFYGYVFEGDTFDCGSKEGFMEANVAIALSRDDMHDSTMTMISDRTGMRQRASVASAVRGAKWSYPIRAAGRN